MDKPKLIRITTVPISLEKLLEGQLRYRSQFYEVTAISSEKERLTEIGKFVRKTSLDELPQLINVIKGINQCN